MSDESRFLDQVLERDIDFALLSAAYASKPFRSFVVERAAGWTGEHTFVRARLSDWNSGRETDVLLIVELNDGATLAIMIEDKISAIFQPDQAHGYRERGLRGISDGRWHRYVTCLCAPETYIRSAQIANEWDSYISFESIVELSLGSDDRNIAFVAAICRQAVAKRAAALLPISAEATRFWHAYRQMASNLLPEAPITRLADAVSSAYPWPRFGALFFPATVFVEHKPQQGRVDLTFENATAEALTRVLPTDLPIDIKLERAGKSTALRIAVPKIDHFQAFDEQHDDVIMALAAVERLLALGKRVVPLLE